MHSEGPLPYWSNTSICCGGGLVLQIQSGETDKDKRKFKENKKRIKLPEIFNVFSLKVLVQ